MENIKKLKNIKMVNNILIAFLTIIPLLGIQLYKNGLDLYICLLYTSPSPRD